MSRSTETGAWPSRGLGRFAADLPAVGEFVTLGEGDTPLVALPALAAELGLDVVSAKLEHLNPTGSYKDRVAAMSVSLARQCQLVGWIATSSGNAGLAMAAYGARAGLPGFLCMVASAPLEKRLLLMPYPMEVVVVDGVGAGSTSVGDSRLLESVRAAAVRHGLYLGITANAFNPDGMRGIDTIAYELVEQAPDATHVYVPTGGGGLLASIARGFVRRSAAVAMVACQPEGCAPIVAFVSGELAVPEVERCTSEISALQLPAPPDGLLAAAAVTESGGWGTAVADGAILAAQQRLATVEGILVEPAAAAGLAALAADVEGGRVGPGDHPVLILSGAGWKDLGRFAAYADRLAPTSIDELDGRVDAWVTELGSHRSR